MNSENSLRISFLSKQPKTNLQRDWFTIKTLVSKDFKLKYRRSVLGVLWSVLNPLLMMCVLTAVFSAFFKFEIEHYPFYLILGNTLFALMADSTNTSMTSIIDSAPLIKKIRIDKIIFPIEKSLFQLVNFAISLIAVGIVMVFLQIQPTFNLLLAPLLLLFVLMFSMGLGLLLSALAVFFRDIIHIWSVVITAWTYATPLFYPASILPEWMMTLEAYNPMYHYVQYFRDIALWGNTPGITENLICFGMAAITLLVGIVVFRTLQKKFILYV